MVDSDDLVGENDEVRDDAGGVADCEWFDVYCEEHSALLHRRDYEGLLQLCRLRLARSPHDSSAAAEVAEAYVLAGRCAEALAFVRPYYEADPENFDFQACILDALAGLGKAWDEFPWKLAPTVIRMSDGVLDECYRFLRPKRKPRSVGELYGRFISRGHLLFSEDYLREGLRADGRFVVTGEGLLAAVSVVRKVRG